MNIEDILKENKGKKFDVVLMNPPYSGNGKGDGLYVKFLNKCILLSNRLISINPTDMIFTHNGNGNGKKELHEYINTFKTDIEIVDSNIFDAGIKSLICIMDIDLTIEDEKINIKQNNNHYTFNKQSEIKLVDSEYFDKFAHKLIKYMTGENIDSYINYKSGKIFAENKELNIVKPNVWDKLKTPNKGDIRTPADKVINKFDKDKYYIYLYKLNASFSGVCYKNSQYEAVEYSDKLFDRGSFLFIEFDKDDIDISRNICKVLNSDFVKLIMLMRNKYYHAYARYMFMPYIEDNVTDNKLFEMIGMNYDKDEIKKILNDE